MSKNVRIQPYLSPVQQHILDDFIETHHYDKLDLNYGEATKLLIMEYQELLEENQKLHKKLNYMDKNISIILQLVSSMAMEQQIEDYPLSESLPYFQAVHHVESLMNYPRGKIQPSKKIQEALRHPYKKIDLNDSYKPKQENTSKNNDDDLPNVFLDNDDDMPNVFL